MSFKVITNRILKCMLIALSGVALVAVSIFGLNQYNQYKIAQPQRASMPITKVSANSSVYIRVLHNDIKYLHTIGNAKAKWWNKQLGYRKYKKASDGNYWSYFEDHPSLLSDDFAIGDTVIGNHSAGVATGINRSRKYSGIIANEEILKKHGVNSGVNFQYSITRHSYNLGTYLDTKRADKYLENNAF